MLLNYLKNQSQKLYLNKVEFQRETKVYHLQSQLFHVGKIEFHFPPQVFTKLLKYGGDTKNFGELSVQLSDEKFLKNKFEIKDEVFISWDRDRESLLA